ncbi:putative cysteine dioxygenase [Aspergillus clavatus NRRL 1]|uniref:Cysteine dioxygenase n=1 Tax=Aspergillus clavatus (strain ATCC 1007 / CBS 513.65 / DSM 816 / NCTC 3887 / NRRL 1 / QM 1276 / 107) TaxID=344612 RepID=A1CC14_ASPCL|nr:cysteine dioxygenase, putative [Aspergillus clavatus NRRL 1]EAW13282.1 cysteine dioxygenase, putative [Aspergillus clavatus NRRL 1]
MSPALCAPFPLAGHLPSLDRIQNYTVSRRPNTLYTLDHLVEDIKQYLGTSGIDDAHVDHTVLMNFMSKYTSSAADWSRYMRNDPSKNYTRNLVADVSGRANLLLLVWNPEKGSPIHDHANAHCIMKILDGELNESVYHTPSPEDHDGPLKIKKNTTYQPNEVAYISDEIGLHRVANPQKDRIAVSLHLYTPPNAADYGYNIYDLQTGRSSHVYQA